ncbi:MAG: class I SAM-dependent methyltransferase [Planctomycetes bacterium]|nr:class I SAM-dependent methyltransferase [Planctomycetota bacterium]
MSKHLRISGVIIAILFLSLPVVGQQEERRGDRGSGSMGGRGYREAADYVVKRLNLRRKSVVVDIGAGDGWWSSKIAEKLGPKGIIHAGEIEQKKVDTIKDKWEAVPQIRPYLCPMDGSGMEENSCDLAFISKTYHHFNKDTHVDYLRHLKKVIKSSGRVVIIERHADLASGRGKEHAWQPGLLGQQAEQAGWMLLRCELIPGSDHFMATLVKPEDFTEKLSKRLKNAKQKKSKNDQ